MHKINIVKCIWPATLPHPLPWTEVPRSILSLALHLSIALTSLSLMYYIVSRFPDLALAWLVKLVSHLLGSGHWLFLKVISKHLQYILEYIPLLP